MRPIKIIISCLLLVIIVTIPDVILELLHGLLELIMELGHILFEIIEEMLDGIIEHVFHTGLHQTQIIVFYIILSVIFYGLFHLCRLIPSYYQHWKETLCNKKAQRKAQITDYWQHLGFAKKAGIIMLGTTFVGIYFFFFL